MKTQKMLLYTAMLLVASINIGCVGTSASSQAPPEIRPGVKFEGLGTYGNLGTHTVKEVRGNWVLCKNGGDQTELWVNFDNVVYYQLQK